MTKKATQANSINLIPRSYTKAFVFPKMHRERKSPCVCFLKVFINSAWCNVLVTYI